MKFKFLLAFVVLFAAVAAAPSTYGQGVRTGPDESALRDPDLERDSHHNLEVAKNYFRLKKAYVAALKRCEEIIAGNPNFAKIEEVLLMAGQSSLWLAQGKGKQNPNLYVTFDGGQKRTLTPEQFRDQDISQGSVRFGRHVATHVRDTNKNSIIPDPDGLVQTNVRVERDFDVRSPPLFGHLNECFFVVFADLFERDLGRGVNHGFC